MSKKKNGGNRKLSRADKRKRYYERHPEKKNPSTSVEGRAWRNFNRRKKG